MTFIDIFIDITILYNIDITPYWQKNAEPECTVSRFG